MEDHHGDERTRVTKVWQKTAKEVNEKLVRYCKRKDLEKALFKIWTEKTGKTDSYCYADEGFLIDGLLNLFPDYDWRFDG